ncbi:hypothetical protein GCM10017673_38320 [Streptosporangium violaceochromogenes]|nr:hypothetical protein GCM10017673_38320 [Streptosporangium violaceochromogenes]
MAASTPSAATHTGTYVRRYDKNVSRIANPPSKNGNQHPAGFHPPPPNVRPRQPAFSHVPTIATTIPTAAIPIETRPDTWRRRSFSRS